MIDDIFADDGPLVNIGIVGAGYIAEAVVEAFLRDRPASCRIALSPRGAETAARLKKKFPRDVTIATSNQAVLDATDVVILAVRPGDVKEIVKRLVFRPNHTVVNVVAGLSVEDVQALVSPSSDVTLAIPLPAMRTGKSVTVIQPPNAELRNIFSRGGAVIETHDARAYAALGTSTAIMSSTFAFANQVARWLSLNGVPERDACEYVLRLLSGVVDAMAADETRDFAKLANDHATPGSFNDFLQRRLTDNGTFEEITLSLDALLPRMLGR